MKTKYKIDFSKRNLMLKLNKNTPILQVQTQKEKVHNQSLKVLLKQRSQSDPKFRKRIYKRVKLFDKDEVHWNEQLKLQLNFGEAIQQFQKIQLNRNMKPTQKLTIRQAYQLKRQISKIIEEKQHIFIQQIVFQEVKKKILLLLEVCLDDKQRQKLHNFNFFFNLRFILQFQNIEEKQPNKNNKFKQVPIIHLRRSYSLKKNRQEESNLKVQYKEIAIQLINNYISNWKADSFIQADVARIKILTIISLHIQKQRLPIYHYKKYHLFQKQQTQKKSFQSRKKEWIKNKKELSFNLLLLYYLKIDQQLKCNHYGQLQAYLQLYSADEKYFNIFQSKYEIQKQLNAIKPASVGINIYLDSKQRNQVKFQSIKKQILNNQQSLKTSQSFKISFQKVEGNYKKILSHQVNSQQKQLNQISGSFSSNNSFNSSNNSTNKIINLKLNNIKNKQEHTLKISQRKNRLSIFENVQKKKETSYKSISQSKNNKFDFIFLMSDQLCRGIFQVIFSNGFSLFQLIIKIISTSGFIINFFKIKSLKNVSQDLKIESFSKIIWSVFKKVFVTNFIQEENPIHLKYDISEQNHIKKYIPNDLHIKEVETMSLIHDYLIYWIHTRKLKSFFNGKSFYIPDISVEQINIFLQNLQNQKDRKNFSKRKGYLNIESSHNKSGMEGKNVYKSVLNQICQNYQQKFDQQNTASYKTQDVPKIKQSIMLSLIKVKDQHKLIKLSFTNFIRQIFIFELGFLKHIRTYQLQLRIKKIRNFCFKNLKNTKKIIQILTQLIQDKNINQTQSNRQREYEQILNKRPFLQFLKQKYQIKQLFQIDLIQNKMLEKSLIQFNIYQTIPKINDERSKLNLKKNSNRKNQVVFKANSKIQIVKRQKYKWGIKYLAYKNQYFILNEQNNKFESKRKNGFSMRIQMYKMFLLQFQQQNSKHSQTECNQYEGNQFQYKCKFINSQKYCLKKKIIKNQKQTQIIEDICTYRQKIFLQIAKHQILKANNKFYVLNFYKSINSHHSVIDHQELSFENKQQIYHKKQINKTYIKMIELVDLSKLYKFMQITQNLEDDKKCNNFQINDNLREVNVNKNIQCIDSSQRNQQISSSQNIQININKKKMQNDIIAFIDFQRKTYLGKRMDMYIQQMNHQSNKTRKGTIFSQANHYYQMWLKSKFQQKAQN